MRNVKRIVSLLLCLSTLLTLIPALSLRGEAIATSGYVLFSFDGNDTVKTTWTAGSMATVTAASPTGGVLSGTIKGNDPNVYMSTTNMGYTVKANDVIEVRMKVSVTAGAKSNGPQVFYRVNGATSYTSGYCSGFGTSSANGSYETVQWSAFGNGLTAGNTLNAIRIDMAGGSDDAFAGTYEIDYIYIGPAENAPSAQQTNALYFNFDGTPADRVRYANPIYGDHNYDLNTEAYWAERNSTAAISNGYMGYMRLTLSGTTPYVESTGKADALNTLPLNYKPGPNDKIQIRLRLTNCAGNASSLLLYYTADSDTTVKKNVPFDGFNSLTHSGSGWVTLTADADAVFKAAKKITTIRVQFPNLTSATGKTGTIDIDYIYIGPLDDHLYFDFTNTAADRERYNTNTYGNINFDLAKNWAGTNYTTGQTVFTDDITVSDGTLTFTNDRTGLSYVSSTPVYNQNPLAYTSSAGDYFQMRVKIDNGSSTQQNSNIEFGIYCMDSDGRYTLINGKTIPYSYVDGKYYVVTFALTDAVTSKGLITSIRPTWAYVSTGAKISIDWIYVGPEAKAPYHPDLSAGASIPAVQNSQWLPANAAVDLADNVEIMFNLQNNIVNGTYMSNKGDHFGDATHEDAALYNLKFTCPALGISIGPDGINLGKAVDSNGNSLEISELTIAYGNYNGDTTLDSWTYKKFSTAAEFQAWLKNPEGHGLTPDYDYIRIRGMYLNRNTLFSTSNSVALTMNITGTSDVKDLSLSRTTTLNLTYGPVYYQWAGHEIQVFYQELVDDINEAYYNGQLGNLLPEAIYKIDDGVLDRTYPTGQFDICDEDGTVLTKSEIRYQNDTAASNTDQRNPSGFLAINYANTGYHMEYLKFTYQGECTQGCEYFSCTHSSTVHKNVILPIYIYTYDFDNEVFVADYGLDMELSANSALTSGETLKLAADPKSWTQENTTWYVEGIAEEVPTYLRDITANTLYFDSDQTKMLDQDKIEGFYYLTTRSGYYMKANGTGSGAQIIGESSSTGTVDNENYFYIYHVENGYYAISAYISGSNYYLTIDEAAHGQKIWLKPFNNKLGDINFTSSSEAPYAHYGLSDNQLWKITSENCTSGYYRITSKKSVEAHNKAVTNPLLNVASAGGQTTYVTNSGNAQAVPSPSNHQQWKLTPVTEPVLSGATLETELNGLCTISYNNTCYLYPNAYTQANWTYTAKDYAGNFRLIPAGNGYYYIWDQFTNNMMTYWDYAANDRVVFKHGTYDAYQQWRIFDLGSGNYAISPKLAPNLYLKCNNTSGTASAVTLAALSGGALQASQKWKIAEQGTTGFKDGVYSFASNPLLYGTYTFDSKAEPGKSIALAGSSLSSGASLNALANGDNGTEFQFTIIPARRSGGTKYYYIKSATADTYLTSIPNSGGTADRAVEMCDFSGGNNQLWVIEPSDPGYYIICAAANWSNKSNCSLSFGDDHKLIQSSYLNTSTNTYYNRPQWKLTPIGYDNSHFTYTTTGSTVDGNNYTLTYSPASTGDFLEQAETVYLAVRVHESDYNPSAIGSTDINHEVEMYKAITVIPASVVYYEDDYPAIQYYKNETIWKGDIVTDGTSGSLYQSNSQSQQYGYDTEYANDGTSVDKSGGSVTKITIDDKTTINSSPAASFSFAGTGFELISRTNATDSATIVIKVKDSSGTQIKLIPVITEFDNAAESSSGHAEQIYQVPVIKVDNLEFGNYTVEIHGVASTSSGKVVPTYLYIDGIRIYNPLGGGNVTGLVDAYIKNEQNATFADIRDLILGGDAGVVAWNESSMTVGTAFNTYTENRIGQDWDGTYTGNVITSVNDYLLLGPNNEAYLAGTSSSNQALVLYVKQTDTSIATLQVGMRRINDQAFFGNSGNGTTGKVYLGVKSGSNYAWQTITSSLTSGTEQYYTIDYTKCPVSDGYYQVVIFVEYGMVSFTNLKYNGLEIKENTGTAAKLRYGEDGILQEWTGAEWVNVSNKTIFVNLMLLSSQVRALQFIDPDEPEVTEPEVTEPEVTEPEVSEPEVTDPEVTEPEVTEPEVTEPEVTEPEVTEPEVTEPEVTEPEVTEPEVTEPEATEPEATEPEVTEPEATEPEVTEPEATEPEVTEPEVTEPEATEPPATEPSATEPPATEPPATEPPATEPEKAEDAVTFTSVKETVYATSGVNVRTGPGTSHSKIGVLSAGEAVTRIGIGSNGWSRVIFNGQEAYISSNYLTTQKPVSNTGPITNNPPATEPPATQPPATEPPVTEPPATEAPVTEPPVTEPPATESPETQPPETEIPETAPQGKEPMGTDAYQSLDLVVIVTLTIVLAILGCMVLWVYFKHRRRETE